MSIFRRFVLEPSYRRLSNIFVYPKFQIKMIILLLLLCLINPVILLIYQAFSFKQMSQLAVQMQLPVAHPYIIFLENFQNEFYRILSISLLLSFFLSLLLGLIITHKIAGPLIKMKERFIEVSENQSMDGPIPFRKGDFFKDLSEAYNSRFKN